MTACASCNVELRANAKFCDECGAPVTAKPAEYKQVTVLFADVVHSMDIAAAVGAERLREIMAQVLDRSAAVVKRYGGTVDKFTGDGIMAVFGAPTSLEDHALRACLAASDIQSEMKNLSSDVHTRDGIDLQLRVGLNSGQVIAGEIGSTTASYTAIGEQVGMAQRMESVAPPGGVMLSESTARLVENRVLLSEPELVHVKGAVQPVSARHLLAVGEQQRSRRSESTLVGRAWELNTVTAILDEAAGGSGCVVNLTGPPGIGKSRLVRETASAAARRGIAVFTAYCESHAADVPFHVVARMLRAGLGIDDLNADAARVQVRDRLPDADPQDLLLLDDLLGIGDPTAALPDIAADARRRRLTALINAAGLAGQEPTVYVIEDVHWIDEVSESMLVDFLAVIPQMSSLVLITYRPEYRGALSRVSGAQSIALRPLNDAQASELSTELLGGHPSVGQLAEQVAARAAGNPFFAEEIVRDLSERGVLQGNPRAYELGGDVADVDVPASLHATIGARIDRLGAPAKATLNAAAVIGSRFDGDLLSALVDNTDVEPLIEAQLVDQVRFTLRPEYAFHHPLIRTVAYESQLRSDRAQLHRHLAAAIEGGGAPEENAALIAEHFEAANDLHAAFDWHMRAGTWFINRDMVAAQTSWRRARQVADRLSEDDADRMSMRIAPRTFLCALAYRLGGSGADTGFDELRELCTATGDQRSLAIGMSGLVIAKVMNAQRREATGLAGELVQLIEAIDDPELTAGLSYAAMIAKHETAEMREVLRLAELVIDLTGNDNSMGDVLQVSPRDFALFMRGLARWCLGIDGWREDFDEAIGLAREIDAITLAGAVWYAYVHAIPYGVMLAGDAVLRDTADALSMAEAAGDDLAVDLTRTTRGVALAHQVGPEREAGIELLMQSRERSMNDSFSMTQVPVVDSHIAQDKARRGEIDAAIELARTTAEDLYNDGGSITSGWATAVLVEALLQRSDAGDFEAARAAIERLAIVPADPGPGLREVPLARLRALLARAEGDEAAYRTHRDHYRELAAKLGFEGHIAWA